MYNFHIIRTPLDSADTEVNQLTKMVNLNKYK